MCTLRAARLPCCQPPLKRCPPASPRRRPHLSAGTRRPLTPAPSNSTTIWQLGPARRALRLPPPRPPPRASWSSRALGGAPTSWSCLSATAATSAAAPWRPAARRLAAAAAHPRPPRRPRGRATSPPLRPPSCSWPNSLALPCPCRVGAAPRPRPPWAAGAAAALAALQLLPSPAAGPSALHSQPQGPPASPLLLPPRPAPEAALAGGGGCPRRLPSWQPWTSTPGVGCRHTRVWGAVLGGAWPACIHGELQIEHPRGAPSLTPWLLAQATARSTTCL